MGEKSSYEIGLEWDEKEKELQKEIKDRGLVLREKHDISREIVLLELKKRDLEPALLKSRENISLIHSELNVLRNCFYRAQKAGI